MNFKWAPAAARLLNGVFCVYKPEGLTTLAVIQRLQENLAKDLNALPCYKYEKIRRVGEVSEPSGINSSSNKLTPVSGGEGQTSYFSPTVVTLPSVSEDLSDHRLVLGERYLPSDFEISTVSGLHQRSSGVMVCGIGSATEDKIPLLQTAQFLRVYHVKGRFGYSTHDYTPEGPLTERTTFYHINKVLVDKVCATIQGSHQKHLFEYAGVHPQSEEAYELACQGLVRPDTDDTPPMIYGVKCINFDLPDITLEIHAINEECMYLSQLIHDFGLKLKSSAVCPQVRRIRYGHFTAQHALLRKDWHLQSILENIQLCQKLTKPNKLVTEFNIQKTGDNVKHLPQGGMKSLSWTSENSQHTKNMNDDNPFENGRDFSGNSIIEEHCLNENNTDNINSL